jgi:hypothetical protein
VGFRVMCRNETAVFIVLFENVFRQIKKSAIEWIEREAHFSCYFRLSRIGAL